MDKFDQFLEDRPTFPVAFLGNGTDFHLQDLSLEPMSPEVAQDLRRRGFYLIGVMGLMGTTPRSALACDLDSATSSLLSQAYVNFVKDRVNQRPQGEGN